MKTLYLDCGMGAAGDMLTAALMELLEDPAAFPDVLNALGLPGVEIERKSTVKCGIAGSMISVKVNGTEEAACGDAEDGHPAHGHCHPGGMEQIAAIVAGLQVSEKVKRDVLSVYGLIAEAESAVHGVPVGQVHFHEVGAMDAVADITAVCLLLEKLAPDEIVASPVRVGSGHVRCAHGILPVPAPAAAYLLRDIPIYAGELAGEFCTPTGAALLKYFVTRFDQMPMMKVHAIGYGMGKKDFAQANCVRAMLGETADGAESVVELSCNVDDMTAEEIGFATGRLLECGALEAYTVPVGMKKSRPGTLIRVICRERDREDMVRQLFLHTSTLGIRETQTRRYVLERRVETVDTPCGSVRKKISAGYGVSREKFEYEDLARIAAERGISLAEARALAENGR